MPILEELLAELKQLNAYLAGGSSIKSVSSTEDVSLKAFEDLIGKDNVHGIDDVEKLLGYRPLGVPTIPSHLFEDSKKLKDRGIAHMLVLFVNVDSRFVNSDGKGAPITGKHLNEMVQPVYTSMGLGKFLYNTTWYEDEAFYTSDPLTLGWKLVAKSCLPGTKGKTHDKQTKLLDGQPRLKPFELYYAIALHLVTTGERLFENEYHWSDVTASDGDFVRVGDADSGGAFVRGDSRGGSGGFLGVCLSW